MFVRDTGECGIAERQHSTASGYKRARKCRIERIEPENREEMYGKFRNAIEGICSEEVIYKQE
jgi:hypothetical protein